jgi:lysozyme family protein
MNPLVDQYEKQFKACVILPGKAAVVKQTAARILANRARYEALAQTFTRLPWWVVGILHSLECNGRFDQHLHNGDPLSARTVQVPVGRPKKGNAPFTWEQSARDALMYDGLDLVTDWSPGSALTFFELYNGLGYRGRGVPSPYLWSFTDQYKAGKYTSDGKYDPKAISQQAGCAALMKLLLPS